MYLKSEWWPVASGARFSTTQVVDLKHLADVLTAATELFIKMADAPRGRGGFGRGRGDRGRGRRGPRRGGRKDEEKEWYVAVSDRAAFSHIPAGSPSPSSVVL